MRHKYHPRRPAPDDGQLVPPGYMRCCVWDHEGPRILPATLEFFRARESQPNGTDPICRTCHRRQRRRRYREVEAPRLPRTVSRKAISGNVQLILAGPEFGVPLHLPRGTLVCSRCFRLLPHDKNHFDLKQDLRVEPVCLECQAEGDSGDKSPP
jgi:hypothetical protein